MKTHLLSFALILPLLMSGQELLVSVDGSETPFYGYRFNAHGSVLDLRTCLTCLKSIPTKSVAEWVSLRDEARYHLKQIGGRSGSPGTVWGIPIHTVELDFLELVSSGKVTVYRRLMQSGYRYFTGPGVTRQYSNLVEYYYVEKDGVLKQVLPADGYSRLQKGLLLKEFVNDDPQSSRQIDNINFKLKPESLIRVVEDYNQRMFLPNQISDTSAIISVLRVSNHPQLSLTIEINGRTSPLNDKAVSIRISSRSDTKVCVTEGLSTSCKVVRGTTYFPLFLEAHVDEATQEVELISSNSKRFTRLARRLTAENLP